MSGEIHTSAYWSDTHTTGRDCIQSDI